MFLECVEYEDEMSYNLGVRSYDAKNNSRIVNKSDYKKYYGSCVEKWSNIDDFILKKYW